MYFFNFLQPSNQFEISHNPHMTTSVQAQHSQEVEKALAGSERALIPPYGGHRLGHMQVYSGTQGWEIVQLVSVQDIVLTLVLFLHKTTKGFDGRSLSPNSATT